MSNVPEAEITQLLGRLREGDAEAGEQVLPLIYESLRSRAEAMMAGERRAVTLQPTALVHEAWLRLQRSPGGEWVDRNHFLRLAGRVMRNVLVDRARRQRAGAADVDPESLCVTTGPDAQAAIDILDLHDALELLAERDPELAAIVDMRFFAGLTLQEVADANGKSLGATHRAWALARSFLSRELRGAGH